MKRYRINYKLIVFIILLTLITILNIYIKDIYVSFLDIFNEEKIFYTDSFTNTYINNLENLINESDNINKLDNCVKGIVSYRNISTWYDSFVINKGSSDGILSNSLVINNNGVVGVITKVYSNYSEALLITNTNLKLSVEIRNEDEVSYGIISYYDKINNLLVVTDLTRGIDSGIVSTSYSSKLKDGIVIGDVVRIEADGINYTAYVHPKVDVGNIRYVCIV